MIKNGGLLNESAILNLLWTYFSLFIKLVNEIDKFEDVVQNNANVFL